MESKHLASGMIFEGSVRGPTINADRQRERRRRPREMSAISVEELNPVGRAERILSEWEHSFLTRQLWKQPKIS